MIGGSARVASHRARFKRQAKHTHGAAHPRGIIDGIVRVDQPAGPILGRSQDPACASLTRPVRALSLPLLEPVERILLRLEPDMRVVLQHSR